MADLYLNSARTQELWVAIKTALAGKLELKDLEDYVTTDALAAAISSALTDYAKDTEVAQAISTALADYMTATEVNDAIAAAVIEASGIGFKTVEELPEEGIANTIYLVPSTSASDKNVKDEYMWIDGAWELFGSTAVNLDNYWSKDDLRVMTAEELKAILV